MEQPKKTKGKSIPQILKKYTIKKSKLYSLMRGEQVVRWNPKKKKIERVKKQFKQPEFVKDIDYVWESGEGYRITKEGESKIAAKYPKVSKSVEIEPLQVVEN